MTVSKPAPKPAAYVLRAATPADVPALLGLVRDLATYEKAPDAVEMTEPMLHDSLFGPTPLARAVVAEAGGAVPGVAILGFAIWFTTFSTWTGRAGLYLEDVFVRPEARGTGIGRALLRHLAREAVRLGCARFEWSVLDWNRPAIDFYQSLG
ncbi:MAG TPA: GNAT family N-acetyltransferase, partial [Acidiphilium sp.]